MNKVYFFEVDPDNGGVFIAARNWKEARNIALYTEVIADDVCDFGFTELHGHRVGDVITNLSGELSRKQLDMLGIDYIKMEDL